MSTTKVYGLTDVVGEAELAARRLRARVAELEESVAALHRGADAVRRGQSRGLGPDDVRRLLDRLLAELPTTGRATRAVAEHAEAHLARVADVRDQAMGLAMVPVRRVTAGLPRLVRQVATSAGRDVQLRLVGEDVELDAQVLDGVADSLKHLVTNAVDHGCEPPEAREAAGKPRTATVTVTARGAGGTVSLEVRDDGGGIDADRLRAKAVDAGLLPAGSTASGPDLLPLLFSAGLSTAEQVSETSGRGVGLDVVKEAVDALGGSVVVDSERGAGTAVTLVLPVTLGGAAVPGRPRRRRALRGARPGRRGVRRAGRRRARRDRGASRRRPARPVTAAGRPGGDARRRRPALADRGVGGPAR